MRESNRRKLYQTKLNQLGLTPEDIMSRLDIDLDTLKRYISGKRYFEEEKYLTFLALIELDCYQMGYVDKKHERTIKSPFELFKVNKNNNPFSKRIRIMFRYNLFKRNPKKQVLEGFGHNLFFDKVYQTPFLYKYFFMLIVAMILADYALTSIYTLSNLLIALSIPMTLLILVFEFDRSKVTLRQILLYFFLGGLASIGLTYLIRIFTGYPDGLFGDLMTGFVEESAKLLIVILIIKIFPVKFAFTGLLIGFAVGAGFDVFETSDYGMFELLDTGGDVYSMQAILLTRSLYALGIGHHFWTGILSGVLVALNKKTRFSFKSLLNPTFIVMYLFVVVAHALWNFNPFPFIGIPFAIVSTLVFYVISFNIHQLMTEDINHYKVEPLEQNNLVS